MRVGHLTVMLNGYAHTSHVDIELKLHSYIIITIEDHNVNNNCITFT